MSGTIESDQESQTQQTHQPIDLHQYPEQKKEQENGQETEENEKKKFEQSNQNSQRKASYQREIIDNEGISNFARNTLDQTLRVNKIFFNDKGTKNLQSLTSKGTKQQVKYKLEVENQELKKEKNLLFTLSDIISALVVYIEIPAYQSAKVKFYNRTIQKIGGFELNAIQIQADVWKDTQKSAIKVNQKCENVC